MELSELKKLVRHFGNVVIIEDDKPSFVVLSYENYYKLEQLSRQETEVAVSHIAPHELQSGLDYGSGLLAANPITAEEIMPADDHELNLALPEEPVVHEHNPEEEEKIRQLNEEIAILRQEIKQREMDELFAQESQG